MPFMAKERSKEIMARSRLRNNYLIINKYLTEGNRFLYTKCVSLLRYTKKNYYENLDENDMIEQIKLEDCVKPYLSDKSIKDRKIHLNEKEELIKSQSETADILNNFFSKYNKKLKNSWA